MGSEIKVEGILNNKPLQEPPQLSFERTAIYKAGRELLKYVYRVTARMDKSLRASLGRRLNDNVANILEYIQLASESGLDNDKNRKLGRIYIIGRDTRRAITSLKIAFELQQMGKKDYKIQLAMMHEVLEQAQKWYRYVKNLMKNAEQPECNTPSEG